MGIKSFLREMGTDVCIWCRWITVLTLALLYVGRLVSGFSPQRLALDPASISVRFVVDKGALEQVSLTLFRFSLVTIIPLILHNSSFPITYSCQKDKRRKLQTLKVLFRRSCSSEQEKKTFASFFFILQSEIFIRQISFRLSVNFKVTYFKIIPGDTLGVEVPGDDEIAWGATLRRLNHSRHFEANLT